MNIWAWIPNSMQPKSFLCVCPGNFELHYSLNQSSRNFGNIPALQEVNEIFFVPQHLRKTMWMFATSPHNIISIHVSHVHVNKRYHSWHHTRDSLIFLVWSLCPYHCNSLSLLEWEDQDWQEVQELVRSKPFKKANNRACLPDSARNLS